MHGPPRTGSIRMSLSRLLARGPVAAASVLLVALLASLAPVACAADAPAPAPAPAPAKSPAPRNIATRVDLNSATEAQLIELPRVGPAMAKAILEYRKQVGTIKSIDELVNVKGIGEKTLEFLRPFIVVAPQGGSGSH